MKNKTNSAERLFQDVRTSSEEMTSQDVEKLPKWTKMGFKSDPNGPKWTHMGFFGALWGPFGPSGTP